MKIVVISGSPHKHGTSAKLVDEFIRGAEEKGHEITRFDAAFKNVRPCMACEHCHKGDGAGCAFKDDMESLNPELLAADMLVMAAPIYYYNIAAQLKVVVDRFYANSPALMGGKKCILITTMEDDIMESADAANLWFRNMNKYMKWETVTTFNAMHVGTLAELEATDYPQQAYELGKGL